MTTEASKYTVIKAPTRAGRFLVSEKTATDVVIHDYQYRTRAEAVQAVADFERQDREEAEGVGQDDAEEPETPEAEAEDLVARILEKVGEMESNELSTLRQIARALGI